MSIQETSRKDKMKEIVLGIASFGLIILFALGYYFFFGRTTVTPCSTSYISGEFNISTLKQQCPSLEKQDVVDAVNEYFDGGYTYKAFDTREVILKDIDSNF